MPCSKDRYIIIDYSRKGIIVSKDVKLVAENIKCLKQTSKDHFLVRLHNYNKLVSINLNGEAVSSLPPCFFLKQEEKNRFLQEIKNKNNPNNSNLIELISKQIFLTNNTNFSIPLKNSIHLLILLI